MEIYIKLKKLTPLLEVIMTSLLAYLLSFIFKCWKMFSCWFWLSGFMRNSSICRSLISVSRSLLPPAGVHLPALKHDWKFYGQWGSVSSPVTGDSAVGIFLLSVTLTLITFNHLHWLRSTSKFNNIEQTAALCHRPFSFLQEQRTERWWWGVGEVEGAIKEIPSH